MEGSGPNFKNITKTQENKRKRRKHPNVFFKDEMVKIFENMEDDVKIMVASFITFFCALRMSELCNLKWQDIDLKLGRVKVVNGKGYKDGYIKMSRECTQVIKKWRTMNLDEEYFLPSDKPEYRHLQRRTVLFRFKDVLDKAGLNIPTEKNSIGSQQHQYKFHTLRHSRCTHLLNNGVPIQKVQHFMRHDKIETTLTYTWITNPELEKMVEKVDSRQDDLEEVGDVESMTTSQIIQQSTKFNDPIEIARRRLACGEMTKREFKKIVEVLQTPLSV